MSQVSQSTGPNDQLVEFYHDKVQGFSKIHPSRGAMLPMRGSQTPQVVLDVIASIATDGSFAIKERRGANTCKPELCAFVPGLYYDPEVIPFYILIDV